MINLFHVECFKIMKSSKNRVLFLLFLLFIGGIVLYNTYMDKNYKDSMIKELKEERNYADNVIAYLEQLITQDNQPADLNSKRDFWKKESVISLQLEYYFKESEGIADWKKYLKLLNEKYENLLYGNEKDYISDSLLNARKQSHETLREHIVINKYYLEKNIQPLPNPYRLTGINFLELMLNGYIPCCFLAICVMFSIDVFQNEFDEGSFKLSFTQPYKRKTLYLIKMASCQLVQMSVFAASLLVIFLILGLFNGFGEVSSPKILFSNGLKWPFNQSVKTGNIRIGSSLQYILLGYLVLTILLFLFELLAIYISFILHSSSNAIGLIAGIIILSQFFSMYIKYNSIVHLIYPLTYVNISLVLGNRINSWFPYGLASNIMICLLLFIESYKKFCTMDMQGGNYA